MNAAQFAGKLTELVLQPIAALLFALGLLLFAWGVIEFLVGLNTESDKKEQGKKHMLWGLVGMFVMFGAYEIMQLLAKIICSQFGGVAGSCYGYGLPPRS